PDHRTASNQAAVAIRTGPRPRHTRGGHRAGGDGRQCGGRRAKPGQPGGGTRLSVLASWAIGQDFVRAPRGRGGGGEGAPERSRRGLALGSDRLGSVTQVRTRSVRRPRSSGSSRNSGGAYSGSRRRCGKRVTRAGKYVWPSIFASAAPTQ